MHLILLLTKNACAVKLFFHHNKELHMKETSWKQKAEGMTDSAGTKQGAERTISGRVFTYLCIAGLGVATVAGWLMFVQGFFPLRAAPGTVPRSTAPAPRAYFDRLVFVVFDALRADFVTDPASSVCTVPHSATC